MKLIISKFVSRCGACQKVIPAGHRCYWQKGLKPLHEHCFKAGKESVPSKVSATVPASSKKTKFFNDFVIDWSDSKRLLLAASAEKPENTVGMKERRNFYGLAKELIGGEWCGFTNGQLNRWLREGYQTTAIQGLEGLAPNIREKRRTRFVEDGDEIHLDRVFSGEDNFMSRDTRRQVIPGAKLNIELDASAGSSEALYAYQSWIARTIYALESAGVDCEVTIYTLSRNVFYENTGIVRTAVRVKKEGEIADFAGISPMFSPAAFRGIMFGMFHVQADREGMLYRNAGSGVTDTWSVRYHPETESVEVRCKWDDFSFPESAMTAQFQQALKDMRDKAK